MPPKVRVVERKLRKYYGYAYTDRGLVEIDPTLPDYDYLSTLIHEIWHIINPDASETEVNKNAATMAHQIWKAGYRSTRPSKRKKSK